MLLQPVNVFFISYAGCAEGTKASDLNDYNSQCHIFLYSPGVSSYLVGPTGVPVVLQWGLFPRLPVPRPWERLQCSTVLNNKKV